MKYRFFEPAAADVSLLGFGAMRLPIVGSDSKKIDEDETTRMIRYAIDNGVNYIDTAYVYHGGQGEIAVGKALANGYREKVFLATKLPLWVLDGPEGMDGLFEEQLKRLNTDCIDMYLVHNIEGDVINTVREWKVLELLERKRAEGKIRFIGFSFHGETPAIFKEALDMYPWDFVQLQVNYMDKDLQAGTEGFEYAVSKGVPIVVMEPLKGGRLTDVMPASVKKYWASLAAKRTPAEWALRWVANLPGVLTILSGMATITQVEENIRVLSDAEIGALSEAELEIIDKAAEEYRKLIPYHCTACKYCLPCSAGIDIPAVIELRNQVDLYGKTDKVMWNYGYAVDTPPSECTACGLCEERCPQHLEIIKAIKESAALFEGK